MTSFLVVERKKDLETISPSLNSSSSVWSLPQLDIVVFIFIISVIYCHLRLRNDFFHSFNYSFFTYTYLQYIFRCFKCHRSHTVSLALRLVCVDISYRVGDSGCLFGHLAACGQEQFLDSTVSSMCTCGLHLPTPPQTRWAKFIYTRLTFCWGRMHHGPIVSNSNEIIKMLNIEGCIPELYINSHSALKRPQLSLCSGDF